MARISIDLPATFSFSATIPVRITDLNYGGHVGNDTILSIIHEARVQFLNSLGSTETAIGGAGLSMSDVVINFKNELFYGNPVIAAVAVKNVSRASFDIVYLLNQGETIIAEAKTGMVCFDYEKRKLIALPDEVKQKWSSITLP